MASLSEITYDGKGCGLVVGSTCDGTDKALSSGSTCDGTRKSTIAWEWVSLSGL